MTETVRKHKAYRLCTDAANALWDKISFWTHGSDVEFDDGTTAEDVKAIAEDAVNWTNDVTSQNVNSYSSVPNSAALYSVYEELSDTAGIKNKTQAEYDLLPSSEKLDPTKYYCITDQTLSGAPLDDDSISNGKVWSAQKIGNELAARDANVADEFNENNTYNTGDYSIRNNALYKCNADNVTGAWDATKWDATTITDEIAENTADISTLNSNITTLSDRVDAHTRGTTVDIINYTSSNQYTCPSDGYITVRSGDNANDYVSARVAGIIDISAKTQQTNYNEYNSLFVKKGLKCYILAKNGAQSTAKFYPMTNET